MERKSPWAWLIFGVVIGAVVCFAFVWLKEKRVVKTELTPAPFCGPKTVELTTNRVYAPHGAAPDFFILCYSSGGGSDTVTWANDDHTVTAWQVQFTAGSPFSNGQTVFSQYNSGPTYPATDPCPGLDACYKYFPYNLSINGQLQAEPGGMLIK